VEGEEEKGRSKRKPQPDCHTRKTSQPGIGGEVMRVKMGSTPCPWEPAAAVMMRDEA
jgi:hypothetical protein